MCRLHNISRVCSVIWVISALLLPPLPLIPTSRLSFFPRVCEPCVITQFVCTLALAVAVSTASERVRADERTVCKLRLLFANQSVSSKKEKRQHSNKKTQGLTGKGYTQQCWCVSKHMRESPGAQSGRRVETERGTLSSLIPLF